MKKIKAKSYTLYNCNNIEALKLLKSNSVDVCISDVPYGLSTHPDIFAVMKAWLKGKDFTPASKAGYRSETWDNFVPQPSFWKEVLRVLKPGGWCLAFFGTRTYDIGTLAMRVAGFEVKDCIQWIFGLHSPAAQRMDRAIDRRKGVDLKKHYTRKFGDKPNVQTEEAKKWSDWRTGLRPACELIAMTRKPLYNGSVVENVLKYGVGAINIEGCRIPISKDGLHYDNKYSKKRNAPMLSIDNKKVESDFIPLINEDGRFPSHLIMDVESGKILDSVAPNEISRFYYHTKSSQIEREWGTEGLPLKHINSDATNNQLMLRKNWKGEKRKKMEARNFHPTLKPIALMRYLCRLVAPGGATVLDPFMGSGSTGIAALLENTKFIGMEMNEGYFSIARTRIRYTNNMIKEHPTSRLKELFG
jgi:DNA modification methylase